MIVSASIVAVGMAFIVVGVIANWGQTRLPGAILITAGGAIGGVAFGFSRPLRGQIWARLTTWRVLIATAAAVVIATPAILAMGSATFGPLIGGSDASNTALAILGALIGLVFTIGTLLAALVSVQAVRDRTTPPIDRELGLDRSEEQA